MVQCSFCKRNILPGTGKLFVFATGKQMYFCSKKCEIHQLRLHHKPAHMKWTNAYEKGVKMKEKEVVPEKKPEVKESEE